MHTLEPHYSWRHLYMAEEDERSPFFGREYSEFEFSNTVYDYYIHPQWDEFGSSTLYTKLLYANYERRHCVIELIGEWNDVLYNDIMFFKREVIEPLIENGIDKFILVGENIMTFHAGDTDYYQEWFEEIGEGWIACVNFRDHVIHEFENANIDYYLAFSERLNDFAWRVGSPLLLCDKIEELMIKRLNP